MGYPLLTLRKRRGSIGHENAEVRLDSSMQKAASERFW
jgi:hypothetical protein